MTTVVTTVGEVTWVTVATSGPQGPQGDIGPTGLQGNSLRLLGSVATSATLPPSGNEIADAYITDDTGHLWMWNGSAWIDAGAIREGSPLYALLAPPAGQLDNVALPGENDCVLDVNTAAGNVDITGFVSQRNGQKVFISNTGPNLLRFLVLDAGSAADNQIRAASNLALVQNQTLTLQKSSDISKWLLI